MTRLARPIPALYTVYILRSTVRHASLYIGSTPNPPRRLKQHNGEARGGAARTSRQSLRPWEMVALVSGFPGMVAALKFEWALTNPHLSLHIPTESRIALSAGTKKNGHPRRPRQSITGILSNLHLLLTVPSFRRWPLQLHFFAADVHKVWNGWCAKAPERLRETMRVLTDFGPATTNAATQGLGVAGEGSAAAAAAASGIHALPLDYAPVKAYVEKARSIFEFERLGACVICHEQLVPGQGLHPVCSNEGCEAVGHLDCWSRYLLDNEDDGGSGHGADGADATLLPIAGRCPKCRGRIEWRDMMTELSLRERGKKEVEKLLKKRRTAVAKKT